MMIAILWGVNSNGIASRAEERFDTNFEACVLAGGCGRGAAANADEQGVPAGQRWAGGQSA